MKFVLQKNKVNRGYVLAYVSIIIFIITSFAAIMLSVVSFNARYDKEFSEARLTAENAVRKSELVVREKIIEDEIKTNDFDENDQYLLKYSENEVEKEIVLKKEDTLIAYEVKNNYYKANIKLSFEVYSLEFYEVSKV